jgi:hypothetical protein
VIYDLLVTEAVMDRGGRYSKEILFHRISNFKEEAI